MTKTKKKANSSGSKAARPRAARAPAQAPKLVADMPQETLQQHRAHTLLEKSVCLTLHCHYLGNTRKVSLDPIDLQDKSGEKIDTDKKQLNLSKRIMDAKLLWPAMKTIIQAKEYLRSRAVPAHTVFGERTYLVPVASVKEIDAELARYAERLEGEALSISEVWDEEVTAQEARLGPKLFNRNDYPSAAEVQSAYGIEWSYVSFAAPEKLVEIDSALAAAAARKHERRLADAFTEARKVLRESLKEIVGGLCDRLTPDTTAGAKKKAIKGSVLNDLNDFISTYAARDMTEDGELARMVSDLRDLASGVTPESLRESERLRADVLDRMRAATAALDGLVEETSRAISFGQV